MRRVNARPRLDQAGVVVVVAGRQDMILSSRTLVLDTDPPRRCAHGFPSVDAGHLRAFCDPSTARGQISQRDGSARNAVVAFASLTAVGVRGHPIQPFPQGKQAPNGAGMVGFALAMFGEEFYSARRVNADLFEAPLFQRRDRPFLQRHASSRAIA